MTDLSFAGQVWQWNNGKQVASWYFVTVDSVTTKKLREYTSTMVRRGFGSIKVEAKIGYVTRQTSVFPDKKRDAYILPLKAEVRKELHIEVDSKVHVELKILG